MPTTAWRHTLNLGDVFHDDALTFEQKRDAIVTRIREAPFVGLGDFTEITDRIERSTTITEFDPIWAEFYDEADRFRVWVKTWDTM